MLKRHAVPPDSFLRRNEDAEISVEKNVMATMGVWVLQEQLLMEV